MARRRSGTSRGAAVPRSVTPGRRSGVASTRLTSTRPRNAPVGAGVGAPVTTMADRINVRIRISEPEQQLRGGQRGPLHPAAVTPIHLHGETQDEIPLQVIPAAHLDARDRSVPLRDAR